MPKPLGGRGKVAPYQTTHLRIPVPLKSKIEALIEDYRAVVIDGQLPSSPYFDNALRILANSRSRDRAVIRRAFAELLGVSEDDFRG